MFTMYRLFTVTSVTLYFLVFFLFLHFFSCRFRAELTYIGFRAHVKIAARIVSYVLSPTCTIK